MVKKDNKNRDYDTYPTNITVSIATFPKPYFYTYKTELLNKHSHLLSFQIHLKMNLSYFLKGRLFRKAIIYLPEIYSTSQSGSLPFKFIRKLETTHDKLHLMRFVAVSKHHFRLF